MLLLFVAVVAAAAAVVDDDDDIFCDCILRMCVYFHVFFCAGNSSNDFAVERM